jgi:signal transduction histidine kinase
MSFAVGRQWLAVALGAALAVAASLAPTSPVVHHQAVLRAILQTAVAIVGTLVALLAFGRYRRSGRTSDLALVSAVALLAWVHTLFGSVPDLISPDSVGSGLSERTEIWGTLMLRLLAAGLLITVVTLRNRTTDPSRSLRGQLRLIMVCAGSVAAATVLLVWLAPVSHLGMTSTPDGSHAVYLALTYLGGGLFLVAFFRLSHLAHRESDRFLGWIAAGCIVAAIASVVFTWLASGESDSLQLGDVLLAAAVCTWAVGAVREIQSYWSDMAEAARSEARRSVALDLHDGLAQELALLVTFTYASADVRASSEWHRQLSLTAERALSEARRAIASLANDDPVPFDADLTGVAHAVSAHDVDVRVEVDPDTGPAVSDPHQRESIVRIVREAVTNAVRHGHARHIDIRLSGDRPTLAVLDDGRGFDVPEARATGRFGLISMEERAASLGASLEIESRPGGGTKVLVQWP